MLQTSHSNLYEVDLVQALATHFVRQGLPEQRDCSLYSLRAPATHALGHALKNTFEVVDEEELDTSDAGLVALPKATLKEQIRITTVDNFQGEEFRIVILSGAFRKSDADFLRISNRINVLLR